MTIGVYKITNTKNGHIYIGQSANIEQRFIRHRWELKHNRHTNLYLQRDWNTYGPEVFTYSVIEECDDDQRLLRESYWISYYGGITGMILYNMLSSEDGHIEETRLRISNTLVTRYQHMDHPTKGRVVSQEERIRMSTSRRGRKHSAETIEKIRQGNLGKHLSEETKEKLRQSRLGKPGPTLGKPLSDEHKAKLREARLGKKMSAEFCKQQSERQFNRPGRYIIQMSKSGDYISVYDSLAKANRATGINTACICETCRGKQKSAGGFVWRYITKKEFDQYYNARD